MLPDADLRGSRSRGALPLRARGCGREWFRAGQFDRKKSSNAGKRQDGGDERDLLAGP